MHPMSSSSNGEPQAVDPVCGMKVNPQTARFRLTWQGQEYVFCAAGCLKAFAEDPETYLKHGPRGMPGHESPTGS